MYYIHFQLYKTNPRNISLFKVHTMIIIKIIINTIIKNANAVNFALDSIRMKLISLINTINNRAKNKVQLLYMTELECPLS